MLGIYTDVSKYLGWIQEKSGLDAGVVNLIYNSTSPITARPTKGISICMLFYIQNSFIVAVLEI
nr:unnamed protein product [Callosobruchus analis]